jgi:hypothetical protein
MSEIANRELTGLLDVETGELLPATVDNAARVLMAARNMDERIRELKREATAYLVMVSEERGTKTLHGERETATVTGGLTTEYDAADLMQLLREAGCPEDRIDAAVATEISYKVNRAVLRQLAAANQDYAAAIELAAREVEKPFRASIKLRRQTNDE